VYQITAFFINHSIEMGMEYLARLGELAGGAFTSLEQIVGRRPSLRKALL
jgi:hypothetical protein